MRVANVYTGKITGLDYRVLLVIIVCWFVCLGLLGYKQIAAGSSAPCGTKNIAVNGIEGKMVVFCEPGQFVFFRINAAAEAKVTWHFDDGSAPSAGLVASHQFSREGNYRVKAIVNNRCEYRQHVVVKAMPAPVAEEPQIKIFTEPEKVVAGNTVSFYFVSNVAEQSVEWKLLGSGEMQLTRVAAFTFPEPGQFTVQLTLNNDSLKRQYKKIDVAVNPQLQAPGVAPGIQPTPNVPPLFGPGDNPYNGAMPPPKNKGQGTGDNNNGIEPPKAEPPAQEVLSIDDETLKGMLQKVLKGEQPMDALYPFLRYKAETKVEVNEKKPPVSLSEFCHKHRDKIIKSFAVTRENDNPKNIQTIKVKVKKSGFLGL